MAYLVFCTLVLGVAFGLHEFWRRRLRAELQEEARDEYARLQKLDTQLLDGVAEEEFRSTYVANQLPRFPIYVLFTIAIFMIGTPVVLAFLTGIAFYAEQWGIIPSASDVATEIYLESSDSSVIRRADPDVLSFMVRDIMGFFYYFLGLTGFWVLVVYLMMRRYHRRAPENIDLEDEDEKAA